MKIHHNIGRIDYLLALYQMSREELLSIISVGLQNPITEEDVWTDEIKVSTLKKIDKIFDKGIQYYLDPTTPKKSKESSIFFRKEKLGGDLNLGAKKIVNQFEQTSLSLSALAKLSEVKFDRKLPRYSIEVAPKKAGREIRQKLNPNFKRVPKEYLVELIRVISDANVLIFEYVETWNKKEKSNIDGFFLRPNNIVIKRNQRSFRREIFTLIHELGHYLLDEEVAEEVTFTVSPTSKIEKWCNEFAYHFLSYEFDEIISKLGYATAENDYHDKIITEISSKTHLSRMALMTRLLISDKISPKYYNLYKNRLEEEYNTQKEEEKKQRELDKEMGIPGGGSTPKAINSPLVISTYQKAYFEGAISEYEFCQRLNVKPEKFEKYIYDSSF